MKIRYEYIVFVIVLLFMFGNWQCQKSKIDKLEKELQATVESNKSMENGFTAERNKMNQELNASKVLQIEYDQMKGIATSQATTIANLQKIITDKTQLAIYYKSQIHDTVTAQTDTIIIIGENDAPVYQTRIEERWIEADIMMGPDVTKLDYTVFNENAFNASYKRPEGTFSFLKERELVLDVQSINPHVKTTGVSSWSPPKRKVGRGYWLGGGVVIGITGILLLLNQ